VGTALLVMQVVELVAELLSPRLAEVVAKVG
jgi:hypothetical protein